MSMFKVLMIQITLVFVAFGVLNSCESKKKASFPEREREDREFKPRGFDQGFDDDLAIEKLDQPPFVYLLPAGWSSTFNGSFNVAAQHLLAKSDINNMATGDPAVFPTLISFFLDQNNLPVINVIAQGYAQDGFLIRRYQDPLFVDNGCNRLIESGWINLVDPMLATDWIYACTSIFPTPLVRFPFHQPDFRPGEVYAAVGAVPSGQDSTTAAGDPFHGTNGVGYSGVIEVLNVDPQSVQDADQILNAYLQLLLMPQTQQCRNAIYNHPNFVLLQLMTVQFKEETGPDLSPPYSPAKCYEIDDFMTIGMNRLRNGCSHPTEVCGEDRHVGPCHTSTFAHFNEVETYVEQAFLVPAMMIKASSGNYKDIWFASMIDSLPLPECGVNQGHL